MSAEATGWVWRNSPHTGATLLVHLAIADVVNDANDWECWLTVEAIATKARVGRSSTVTALTTLVDFGLLTVAERGGGRGRPTRYTFLMPGTPARETGRNLAGSERRKPAGKPRGLMAETARSAAPIRITEGTEITRKPDSDCRLCHGSGSQLSSSPGPDGEPFLQPCACMLPDYEPAPRAATRPPPGFGLPAQRQKEA